MLLDVSHVSVKFLAVFFLERKSFGSPMYHVSPHLQIVSIGLSLFYFKLYWHPHLGQAFNLPSWTVWHLYNQTLSSIFTPFYFICPADQRVKFGHLIRLVFRKAGLRFGINVRNHFLQNIFQGNKQGGHPKCGGIFLFMPYFLSRMMISLSWCVRYKLCSPLQNSHALLGVPLLSWPTSKTTGSLIIRVIFQSGWCSATATKVPWPFCFHDTQSDFLFDSADGSLDRAGISDRVSIIHWRRSSSDPCNSPNLKHSLCNYPDVFCHASHSGCSCRLINQLPW